MMILSRRRQDSLYGGGGGGSLLERLDEEEIFDELATRPTRPPCLRLFDMFCLGYVV
jgi:hypothetical protein